MTYRPYRTPRKSTARGPIITPKEVTTYPLDVSPSEATASQLALAKNSARFLGKLGMPDHVKLALAIQDNADESKGEVPFAKSEYFLEATREAEDEYAFDAEVPSYPGVLNAAKFTLWRPRREGFVIPWGIHVHSSSRTLYPRLRSAEVTENSSLLADTVAVSYIGQTLAKLASENLAEYNLDPAQTPPVISL